MTTTAHERSSSRLFVPLCALVALTLAATILLRLSSYGIWDPWELSVADAARKLNEGTADAGQASSLALRLVQASFGAFGTREWAGRLPMAVSGLVLLGVLGLWVRRFSGRRAALYAALALGTTPLFLLHSREMVGATPAFLAALLATVGATNAIYAKPGAQEAGGSPWPWLGLAALGSVLGIFTAGALLTTLPALAAVTGTALLTGAPFDAQIARPRRIAAWGVIAATCAIGILVVRTIFHHGAEFSVWTGGAPLDGAVPTFERILTHLFHGLAPWSAAAPVAIAAALWRTAPERAGDAPLRLVCVLWSAFGFGAATVFLSSYGSGAFPAPGAVMVIIALWLRDLEERDESFWPELVITLLMLGLIVRDYVLYPSSPFDGLELANAIAPDRFNPKLSWSLVLGGFGLALALSCMATSTREKLDLRAPYRGLLATWQQSPGHRAWLSFFALLWLALLLFGAISLISPPGVRLTSIAKRIGRVVGAVGLLLPVLLALGQALFHGSSRLARVRNVPVLLAALICGVYTSQVFLPKLSGHLSPREVFDLFGQLAGPSEPLAQYQVHGRAAAYYVHQEVRDISIESELVSYLAAPDRRWALLPVERLPDVDVAFRRRTGRHLFLPSPLSARVALVSNLPVEGRKDQNPLAQSVLKEPRTMQHAIGTSFDGKIELVGYDLELPQPDYVGAGQSFTVTWLYRVLASNLGAWQAFLHVDAEGQRINGDHEPVDGMYPVRLWDQGDFVLDRQRISVPATTPPGTYTMYTGFFRGDTRLKVTSGPRDDADRALAGTIQIR